MNLKPFWKKVIAGVCAISAAMFCSSARAEETVSKEKPAEIEPEATSFVSGSASMTLDSKYLSYGFVDNNDPILTPAAELCFFDWVTFGVCAVFDITRYGHNHGYTSREWEYTELHPTVTLGHSFSSEDFEWLPTTVDLSITYDYEYIPNARSKGGYDEYGNWDKSLSEDTQFWTFEIGLPELWIEPVYYCEFDTMRDHGIYMNLELGHTFSLIDGDSEEDDPVLSLRPSIAQGWGTHQRVAAYAWERVAYDADADEWETDAFGRSGLMDTILKAELTWNINEYFSLSGYVGYSDFLFDGDIRDASRYYAEDDYGDVTWHHSWNFIAGFAITASF